MLIEPCFSACWSGYTFSESEAERMAFRAPSGVAGGLRPVAAGQDKDETRDRCRRHIMAEGGPTDLYRRCRHAGERFQI